MPDPRDRPFPPDSERVDAYVASRAAEQLDHLKAALDAVELPATWTCAGFDELADRPWTQWGDECTGFALSAIAEYHLREAYRQPSCGRTAAPKSWADASPQERARLTVSRRMMYEMGQLYDRASFRTGSTPRGVLKGWRMVGVAQDSAWPYAPDDEDGQKHGKLTLPRVVDAVARPGGAYYSIPTSNVTDMKKALALNYPLLASAQTHVGWIDLYLPDDALIEPDDRAIGGHAFVIVGWNEQGWRIYNSWGSEWGDGGYATLPYDDFAVNGHDVWFVFPPGHRTRPELPEDILVQRTREAAKRAAAQAAEQAASAVHDDPAPAIGQLPPPAATTAPVSLTPVDDEENSDPYTDMWLHVITLGDDGRLMPLGTKYGIDDERIKTMLFLFRQQTEHWSKRRLAIFADGGYWSTERVVQQLRPLRDELLAQEIYPLFLLWETPWYTDMQAWIYGDTGIDPEWIASQQTEPTSSSELGDALRHDIADVALKFAVAEFSAPRIWNQLVCRAQAAAAPPDGGIGHLAHWIAYNRTKADFDIHLITHGAGDLLLSELATLLPAPITSCNLWAPATTIERFSDTYGPMLDAGFIEHLTISVLDTASERADSMGPVPGSVLQLVSDVLAVEELDINRAIEQRDDGSLVWLPDPRPLLGLQSCLDDDEVARRRAAGTLDVQIIEDATHVGMLRHRGLRAATVADISTRSSAPGAATGAATGDGSGDRSGDGTAVSFPPRWAAPFAATGDPLDWFITD